jgi:hypothetical protein
MYVELELKSVMENVGNSDGLVWVECMGIHNGSILV